MSKSIKLLYFFIFLSISAYGQSNYEVFRSAISILQNQGQAEKAKLEKAVELSEKEVAQYRDRKPQVSVFGGSPEENEAIADQVVESIEEMAVKESVPPPPPPPPPPSEGKKTKQSPKSTKSKKAKRVKLPLIDFKQVYMFPDKALSDPMVSAAAYEKQPKKKMEWIESDVVVSTEIFAIEDIKDEKERDRSRSIGEHNGNIIRLNQIGFINAVHTETATNKGYNGVLESFKEQGHDFNKYYKVMAVLEKDEKVDFIKSKLQEVIALVR